MSSGLANIDLVEVLFTLFWVFFIALVYYLQKRDETRGLSTRFRSLEAHNGARLPGDSVAEGVSSG